MENNSTEDVFLQALVESVVISTLKKSKTVDFVRLALSNYKKNKKEAKVSSPSLLYMRGRGRSTIACTHNEKRCRCFVIYNT